MTIAAFPAAAPLTVPPARTTPRIPIQVVRGPSPWAPPTSVPTGPAAPAVPAPRPAPVRARSLGRPAPPAARPAPTARRLSSAASGRVLLAVVAAGAVLPAVQTIGTPGTHTEVATATLQGAQLALAAQPGGPVSAAAAATSAVDGVTTIAMAEAAASSSPTATAALTKAVGVARESGTPRFGTPYVAGNEKTLDGQIAKALGLLGLPQKLGPGVKQIIMRESTGNARAINNWDSNASAGTPSKGLMQLIEPTFRNAVLPSLAAKGIYDPVANITAGVRTMIANHGIGTLMNGGRRNAAGHYIGYGGGKTPTDGLGIASRS